MSILQVENVTKHYEKFTLDNVSFNLKEGKITGFIGRNGAGKSTTLKSLFNFVHKDSGTIRFFDQEYDSNEYAIKQQVGFVLGGVNYYGNKKLKTITNVTKTFYDQWDEGVYQNYCEKFAIDESKTPAQLSEGMKVKYSLALALSHHAKLLILDEPTSGLDPVSRDELLDIFMDLCEEGTTILFSTHITTDLEKCGDQIIYIRKGKIIADDTMKHFMESHQNMDLSHDRFKNGVPQVLNLENIMTHLEREESHHA